jgi:hypothetical protein
LFASTDNKEDIFQEVFIETEKHKEYLSQLGLGERAHGIQVSHFIRPEYTVTDLSIFDRRTTLPSEVLNFDPKEPNTLFMGNNTVNDPTELNKILDIRLYPVLRKYIRNEKLEIFLGSCIEMASYYQRRGLEIILQFTIPSSAVYYLAISPSGEKVMIMSGLVSRENLIAQLITLKLAEIPLESIAIIGEVEHFKTLVERDITAICQLDLLKTSDPHILIVAGCGLQEVVSEIVHSKYSDSINQLSFQGNIIRFRYLSIPTPTKVVKCCVLDLVYGEIMETIVKRLLDTFSFSSIFSSSAGGYIDNGTKPLPQIGDWISIKKSMNMAGEIAALTPEKTEDIHLQIPSIFMETFAWLDQARKIGSSVDVETFYILRAISDFNENHPQSLLHAHCGYFVSDYVGKKPLRDYSLVYKRYPEVLGNFFEKQIELEKK